MFFPEGQVRVYVYGRPVDLRKSYDGLYALTRQELGGRRRRNPTPVTTARPSSTRPGFRSKSSNSPPRKPRGWRRKTPRSSATRTVIGWPSIPAAMRCSIRNGQTVVAIRDPALGRQYFTPIEEFRQKFYNEAIFTKR